MLPGSSGLSLLGDGAVDGEPVAGDFVLGSFECHAAVADLVVEVILDRIFLMKTRCRVGRFGPEIGDIV